MTHGDRPVPVCNTVENYLAVKDRVWRAAGRAGRDPASVKLIAVSKTFEAGDIRPLLDEGHLSFGENRVQEAMEKWPGLRDAFPHIDLHLIGPLQTNKVKEAVRTFDCIQTVDRPKLAAALAAETAKQGKAPKLFIQVNIGLEPQKAGAMPQDAVAFVEQCRAEYGLQVAGLMAIPPVDADPVPYFKQLRAMADAAGVPELSMGMSGDYEAAIAAGATAVRVGSAIFGAR